MPTHTPEPTRSVGRRGLIPYFLWVCVKAPLSTTAAGGAALAQALLLHNLSYNKNKNQIHLLKPFSIKTTTIAIIFMATYTVMSTWTEHPLAVSKDVGCSCNLYHFSAPGSHFTEMAPATTRLSLTSFAQKNFGRTGSVPPKTLKWARRECVIYGASNL